MTVLEGTSARPEARPTQRRGVAHRGGSRTLGCVRAAFLSCSCDWSSLMPDDQPAAGRNAGSGTGPLPRCARSTHSGRASGLGDPAPWSPNRRRRTGTSWHPAHWTDDTERSLGHWAHSTNRTHNPNNHDLPIYHLPQSMAAMASTNGLDWIRWRLVSFVTSVRCMLGVCPVCYRCPCLCYGWPQQP